MPDGRPFAVMPTVTTRSARSARPSVCNASPAKTVKRLVFSPMATPRTMTESSVKPGWRRRLRTAKRVSCHTLSSHGQIHSARASSRASVTLPSARATADVRRRRPCRRASSSCCFSARWNSSSRRSAGVVLAGREPVAKAAKEASHRSGLQHPLDRDDEPVELVALCREPLPAGGGERVVAGAAVVLGRRPIRP